MFRSSVSRPRRYASGPEQRGTIHPMTDWLLHTGLYLLGIGPLTRG